MKIKSLIKRIFGKKGESPPPNELLKLMDTAFGKNQPPFYSVSPEDWYKAYPYRFKIVVGTKTTYYYSLPIPPEALSYQMIAASQLIPTLGGVVEETSATVFWQISLSGTMGTGISRQLYAKNINKQTGTMRPDELDRLAIGERNFRTVLKGGVLANNFNKIVNAADAVQGAIEDLGGAVGLLEGLASTAQRYNTSAVRNSIPDDGYLSDFGVDLSKFGTPEPNGTNGYVETHLFHNFLNAYSHLKEKDPENTKLFFESQKDNMEWQVVVKSFIFQKNANQPYLYKYNISLQGFDLQEVGDKIRAAVDRFGPDGDLGDVSSFTLSGAAERAHALKKKMESISRNPSSLWSKPPVI
jgi:hypothetical protein